MTNDQLPMTNEVAPAILPVTPPRRIGNWSLVIGNCGSWERRKER
jgi:hypothetical protein